ncbi:MAG TPA: substrate-binding domain-containing protein, partial [Burkholderiaceae bacterium]|nr:substrate-binding domain-containing protein [Burkholderiaceae bacterium]
MARATEEAYVLSAGAAQGVVAALAPAFLAETGVALHTTFGAVGAIREKLLAGERCDALILTEAMINELTISGRLMAATRGALGSVRTGIGVRAGDALPDITSRAALERSLRAATDIFLPDPERATAGIHLVRVLGQLEIHAEVAPRLRPYPNGATAMRALAQSDGRTP